MAAFDVIVGVVPVILAVAFIILILKSMREGRGDMVERMKQAVGATVMLMVALMIVFAFMGGEDEEEDELDYDLSDGRLTISSNVPSYSSPPWTGESPCLIVIDDTVESIGSGAFYGLDSDILFKSIPPVIADDAFGHPFEYPIEEGYYMLSDGYYISIPIVPLDMILVTGGYVTGISDSWEVPDIFVMILPESYGDVHFGSINKADCWSHLRYVASTLTRLPTSSIFEDAKDLIMADFPALSSIQPSTFKGCVSLKSVIASATVIYDYAFQGCVSLVNVSNLENVRQVGISSFQYCAAIDFPVMSSLSILSDYSFSHCSAVESFSFPAITSVSGIDHVFEYCLSLKELDLSKISNGISDGYNFQNCISLTTVSLGKISLTNYDFANCFALKSISGSPTQARDYVFSGCTSLESVDLPSITYVGSRAFSGCTSLKSVNLPAVTYVGTYAFTGCSALKTIMLSSTTNIQGYAFQNCTAVTYVQFGPLSTATSTAFNAWTFYDTDGTTVLSKTAANLANSTFQGVYNALVKVDPSRGLSPDMERRVAELSAENSLKASMLAELDPELAELDSTEVARMTVSEIESMTADDVRAIKSSLPSRSG